MRTNVPGGDPVLVGIASIPERTAALEHVVESLAPQADRIEVSLNGYATRPSFLADFPNVHATIRPVNGGDAEKFAAVDEWRGIVATCDDDLLYPADYIETLLAGLARHGSGTIVGFHGGKTLGWNGSALAASHKQVRCLSDLVEDDVDVNVLGTGVLAFDARRVPIWRDLFAHPNMADVWLACHAHRFGIPMVALAHESGWLRDICPAEGRRIYDSNRFRDGTACDTNAQRERELICVDWLEPTVRPKVRVSVATCERAHLLPGLLADLEREACWLDAEVAVYEDHSPTDYRAAREICDEHGWDWHRFDLRLGKRDHWKLVNRELDDCRRSDADWFVFLPDDVRLVRHALARAVSTWQRLEGPSTLTLWRLKDQEGLPNWTGVLPVERADACEIFHVDGIYLCRRETLEALEYRVPTIGRRRPPSSGVGWAMSRALHAMGARMYRVKHSLALPVPDEPSVMNPEVRDRPFEGIAL